MTDIFDSPDSALSPTEMDMENPELHYDSRQFSGEAVVDEEIRPEQKGRVQFRSSWWFARCEQDITLAPGERVEVLGLLSDTLTLLVSPYPKRPSQGAVEPVPVAVGSEQPLSSM
jgi:hypothetical protein